MTTRSIRARHKLKCLLVGLTALTLAACSSPEEKAQAHLERGQELLAEGDYTSASLEFRNAIKFNEKLAQAWFGLSKVLEEQKDWRGVSNTLTKVLELDPNHFEANLQLGRLLLMSGNVDQALERLTKANDLKPDTSEVLSARAAALLRGNDREAATRDAERALALNPDNPDAHAVFAADALIDNNYAKALLSVDRGLATTPDNLGLLLMKLRIAELQNDTGQIEAVLKQMVAAHPDRQEFRGAMVAFLIGQKRMDDAEKELRASAEAAPKDSAVAMQLVRFIGDQKGPDAARAELERLITARPDTVEYQLALAELDYSQKRTDDAFTRLQEIIDRNDAPDDARKARLLLARMKLDGKDLAAASDLIGKVLEGDARNADALALRASIRLERNEVDGAIIDLREALSQQPESVSLLQLLGRAHELQGAVELADDRYAQAVKLSNYAPAITLDYINFLNRRGKNEQAERILSEAVARVPTNPQLLTSLAQVRLNRQDWSGAEAVAEALRKTQGENVMSEQIVGASQLGRGNINESIEAFKNVYTQSQGDPRPMATLVTAYVRANRAEEAKALLETELAANPNNADALVMLGDISAFEKNPKQAEVNYKLAVERQPSNHAGYVALARHYASTDKLGEAETVLKAGLEKLPDNTTLAMTLGGVFEAKKDFEAAIGVYEGVLEKRPNSLIVVNNLASLLADYRQDEESLERARQLSMMLQSTEVPYFKDTLGWVAYRRGEYRTALSYLEEAVKQLPNLGLVRYHLGMTLAKLERFGEAEKELKAALGMIEPNDPLKALVDGAILDIKSKSEPK